MLSNEISSQIITIGPNFTPPKGGVAQVIDNYRRYILGDTSTFVVNSSVCGKLGNLMWAISGMYQMLKAIRKDKGKRIVHIHTASYLSFRRASIFAKVASKHGLKVIMHIHGALFKEYYASNSDYVKRQLMNCDAVVVLSPTWKRFFEENQIHHNIQIVNNIVDPPIKNEVPSDNRLHALFLGLLGARKGVFDLLNAVNSIKDKIRGRFLLHIGGNGECNKVEAFIRDNQLEDIVKFEGWVSGEKKVKLLNQSSLNILPTYNEGLPLTLLEALGYGQVIISTPVGGIPEIVDESNGFLLQPGDVDALARTILYVVDNKDSLKELSDVSQQRSKLYTPDYVEKQLLDVYNSLLG